MGNVFLSIIKTIAIYIFLNFSLLCVSRKLYIFLSMLVLGDEDSKSEAGTDKEKEGISAIISIFQSIKFSEDIVDGSKTKVGDKIHLLIQFLNLNLSMTPEQKGVNMDSYVTFCLLKFSEFLCSL